ncbi:zinc knuckle CX2CX4HX4C [Artemisia annua]|uniref:Zinc knuckle CX2CX4HX4C n=1 Tax=Artemisia annua TaxID=35608 RepID=A0A2U1P8V4_ARTAN|nr:zinc knuckle CX2CX4HX4C [Artemisia annua]
MGNGEKDCCSGQVENTVSKDTVVEDGLVNEVIEAEKGLDEGNDGNEVIQNGIINGGTTSAAIAIGISSDSPGTSIGVVDKVTGLASTRYARVLVEVSSKKCLPEVIEVVYRDREKVEICRKAVKIQTEWVPPRCAECCIFGHTDKNCGKFTNKEVPDVIEVEDEQEKGKNKEALENDNVGFKEVRYKRGNKGGNSNRPQNYKPNHQFQKKGSIGNKDKAASHFVYQKKHKEDQQENTSKEQAHVEKKTPVKETASSSTQSERKQSPTGNKSQGRAWNAEGEILEAIKRFANKYAILDPYKNGYNETCGFENVNDGSNGEVNDVYKDENGIGQCMESEFIEGRDKEVLT